MLDTHLHRHLNGSGSYGLTLTTQSHLVLPALGYPYRVNSLAFQYARRYPDKYRSNLLHVIALRPFWSVAQSTGGYLTRRYFFRAIYQQIGSDQCWSYRNR